MYKRIAIFILIFAIIGAIFALGAMADISQEDTEAEYIMGPGDLIEISVWNHPELTKTMRIRPDGRVGFPLVGDIQAEGITPSRLTDKIQRRLTKYLKNPKVSVIVMDYKSKNILVIGDVKTPGIYQYEGNMTTFDAIGVAGGYGRHAELRSILVIRDAYSDRPEFYVADLYSVIRDADVTENLGLRADDIVYVPKNFIGNLGDFMDYFLSRVQPIAASYFFVNEAAED